MGRIIAIDWGGKRTGLAWTDPMQMIASRLEGIATTELLPRLQELVKKEEINGFVLGMPTRLDGSDTHSTQRIRQFRDELRKTFPEIPVEEWDERFTSKQAVQSLIAAGVPKKKRRDKSLVDQVSAVLMLQEYLENK